MTSRPRGSSRSAPDQARVAQAGRRVPRLALVLALALKGTFLKLYTTRASRASMPRSTRFKIKVFNRRWSRNATITDYRLNRCYLPPTKYTQKRRKTSFPSAPPLEYESDALRVILFKSAKLGAEWSAIARDWNGDVIYFCVCVRLRGKRTLPPLPAVVSQISSQSSKWYRRQPTFVTRMRMQFISVADSRMLNAVDVFGRRIRKII